MKLFKIITYIAVLLIPAVCESATLSAGYMIRRYEASLTGFENGQVTTTGSYQGSGQLSDAYANTFAEQDSTISLSGNVLTISGSGEASAECSISEDTYAASSIGVNFTIDSPFYYSVQAAVSQADAPSLSNLPHDYYYFQSSAWLQNATNASSSPIMIPVFAFGQCDSYPNQYASGPLSGSVSGVLPPGEYLFDCGSVCYNYFAELRTPPYSDSGQYQILLTISPTKIVNTTVSGHITDAHSGLPVTGVSMQIGPLSVSSDANGFYSQSNLPPATYTVIASANNYISQTNTVTTSSLQTNVTQNFALSQLPKLDYFGVGVNWQNVDPPGSCSLRGDIGATELYYHLRSDLSSICNAGTVVSLDASATTIYNLDAITTQFRQFTNSVFTNDTVVFYVDCHAGVSGLYGIQISLASDYYSYPVFDALTIAGMLDSLPATTRKVVILDTCHSGGIAEELVDSVANTEALAACSATSVAQYVCNAGSDNGISVFTSAIITNLDNGIFDLHRIAANINADAFGVYENDIGQNLNLEDTGSAVFTGLQPQIWESSGFTGNLTNSVMSVVQPAPKETKPTVANGEFKMTLTNVPSSGSIAVEISTNLNSWLQVAFGPATGTNINYSFSVSNAPCQFFRTIVVQ